MKHFRTYESVFMVINQVLYWYFDPGVVKAHQGQKESMAKGEGTMSDSIRVHERDLPE